MRAVHSATPARTSRRPDAHARIIVERGSHDELLRQNGLYAGMWNRQRVAAEAEERLREVEETDPEAFIQRAPETAPAE